MKVKELLEELKGKYNYVEVYSYTSRIKKIHTDFIKEEKTEYCEYAEVEEYEIMDAKRYNYTILANADSIDWLEENERILVIMIKEDWKEDIE